MKWFLSLFIFLMSVSPAISQTQIFSYPRIGGYAVDRCLYYGSQCNQPAADEFCKRKGFQRARRYKWDFMAPTRILATGQICNRPGRGGCGGFTFIECQGRRGQQGGMRGERTFNYPRIGGYAVDHCLHWATQCNQPAANEFCRRNGYQRASRYKWDYMQTTRVLATGQICRTRTRPGCGGFTQITCVGGRGGGPTPPIRGGKGGPGDPCRTREECRSGICLLGVCSQ